jgi:hypothetical protein
MQNSFPESDLSNLQGIYIRLCLPRFQLAFPANSTGLYNKYKKIIHCLINHQFGYVFLVIAIHFDQVYPFV